MADEVIDDEGNPSYFLADFRVNVLKTNKGSHSAVTRIALCTTQKVA